MAARPHAAAASRGSPPSPSTASTSRATRNAGTPDRVVPVKGLSLVVLAAVGMLFGAHDALSLVIYAAIGDTVGFLLPGAIVHMRGALSGLWRVTCRPG